MAPLRTTEQVAELFSVSARTVRRWVTAGYLRPIDVTTSPLSKHKKLRYTEADVEAFVKQRGLAQSVLNKPTRTPVRPANFEVII